MKRLLILLLSVLCCFLAISCSTENPRDIESSSEPSVTDTLTTEVSKPISSLTLAGNSLEGYTIVYAASPYDMNSNRITAHYDKVLSFLKGETASES